MVGLFRGFGGVGLGRQILAGRHALGALEYPREIELVKEAYRHRHLCNGKAAGAQQFAGFVDALLSQVVVVTLAHIQHEHPVQVAAGNPHALGYIVNGDVVGVVELDVLDGVQHILAG